MSRLRPTPPRYRASTHMDVMEQLKDATSPSRSAPLSALNSQELLRVALAQLESCHVEMAVKDRKIERMKTTLRTIMSAAGDSILTSGSR